MLTFSRQVGQSVLVLDYEVKVIRVSKGRDRAFLVMENRATATKKRFMLKIGEVVTFECTSVVKVQLTELSRNKVRLCWDAPAYVPIWRKELCEESNALFIPDGSKRDGLTDCKIFGMPESLLQRWETATKSLGYGGERGREKLLSKLLKYAVARPRLFQRKPRPKKASE